MLIKNNKKSEVGTFEIFITWIFGCFFYFTFGFEFIDIIIDSVIVDWTNPLNIFLAKLVPWIIIISLLIFPYLYMKKEKEEKTGGLQG